MAPKASSSSRKNKASWRKNIDLTAVDEHLEATRSAERLGLPRPGADPEEGKTAKDTDLFQVDVQGDAALGETLRKHHKAKLRASKPMRSLMSLENPSAVKAFQTRKGTQSGDTAGGQEDYRASRRGTGKMSKAEKDRLRRLAARPVKGPFGAIVDSEQGNNGVRALESVKGSILKTPEEDAWAAAAAEQQSPDEVDAKLEWLDDPRRKPIKTPAHLVAMAAEAAAVEEATTAKKGKKSKGKGKGKASDELADTTKTAKSALTPIALPAAGQSYNPSAKAHAALLQRAYEIELAKTKTEEEARAFKDKWAQAGKTAALLEQQGDSGERFAGMIIGAGDVDGDDSASEGESSDKGEGDEDDEEDEDEGAPTTATSAQSSDPQRKTKQQRAKERRAKEAAAQLSALRTQKTLRSTLARLPALEKQLRKETSARAAAITARRLAKAARRAEQGLAGERSGKFRVPSDVLSRHAAEVQLEEELSEGLRAVRPEGNLFRDRWDSLQARGLAEPRVPFSETGRNKRKRGKRTVEYETHAYRRFV